MREITNDHQAEKARARLSILNHTARRDMVENEERRDLEMALREFNNRRRDAMEAIRVANQKASKAIRHREELLSVGDHYGV